MGNMMTIPNVGIIGVGVYLPEKRMTAKEVSGAIGQKRLLLKSLAS